MYRIHDSPQVAYTIWIRVYSEILTISLPNFHNYYAPVLYIIPKTKRSLHYIYKRAIIWVPKNFFHVYIHHSIYLDNDYNKIIYNNGNW